MLSESIVIRATYLGKQYFVYDAPGDRLRQFLFPRLQRAFGTPERAYFTGFNALADVSFEIRRGETVGIIGRNGSGKSTLLQILCGTMTPTAGTLQIEGRVAALLELGAGFNPEFTGRENVYLNGSLFGLTRGQIDERFESISEFADIGNFIEQPVKSYSSGMFVRLAFAVVAHVDADILVIDEALAVGDAYFTQKCFPFLREFAERGTLIFVSHDAAAVKALCSRALLLERGRVTADGDPKSVVEKYLAGLFEGEGVNSDKGYRNSSRQISSADSGETVDMRQDFLNATNLRNDLQVFRFDPAAAGFGARKAEITNAWLEDSSGNRVSWIVGGELVRLRIVASASDDLRNPIVGFYLKDRLGQFLFGDNTYLSYLEQEIILAKGDGLEGVFEFRMPILPVGDYSVDVAIATGSQVAHVQQHWIHDAFVLQSHSASVAGALVGIPMRRIELRIVRRDDSLPEAQ